MRICGPLPQMNAEQFFSNFFSFFFRMSEIPTILDRINVVTSRGKSKWDFIQNFTKNIDVNLTSFDELLNQGKSQKP